MNRKQWYRWQQNRRIALLVSSEEQHRRQIAPVKEAKAEWIRLDRAIIEAGKAAWAKHPNNPTNKPRK